MKNQILTIPVICATLSFFGCSSMAQNGSMIGAHEAYEKGNFKECLSYTSEAEYYGSHSRVMDAQIMFYKAMCLEGLGQIDASKGIFEKLVRLYPESDWAIVAASKLLNETNTSNSL